MSRRPAEAAIRFAIEHQGDSPIEFLQCWYDGEFDTLREEWPEAPEEVFIGADPLHPKTLEKLPDEESKVNTPWTLLAAARDRLWADGQEQAATATDRVISRYRHGPGDQYPNPEQQ